MRQNCDAVRQNCAKFGTSTASGIRNRQFRGPLEICLVVTRGGNRRGIEARKIGARVALAEGQTSERRYPKIFIRKSEKFDCPALLPNGE